jgi:hypothetical protein
VSSSRASYSLDTWTTFRLLGAARFEHCGKHSKGARRKGEEQGSSAASGKHSQQKHDRRQGKAVISQRLARASQSLETFTVHPRFWTIRDGHQSATRASHSLETWITTAGQESGDGKQGCPLVLPDQLVSHCELCRSIFQGRYCHNQRAQDQERPLQHLHPCRQGHLRKSPTGRSLCDMRPCQQSPGSEAP